MSECFPPVPLYIVTATIVAMFTTVTAKSADSAGEVDRFHSRFAAFLLIVVAIPFIQLLLLLLTSVVVGRCGAMSPNTDARWILIFHAATVVLLPVGAAYWHWYLSNVGRRLRL